MLHLAVDGRPNSRSWKQPPHVLFGIERVTGPLLFWLERLNVVSLDIQVVAIHEHQPIDMPGSSDQVLHVDIQRRASFAC